MFFGLESIEQFVLPPLLELTGDTVPNVRLLLARTLSRALQGEYFPMDGPARLLLIDTLSVLGTDLDADVAFYSTVPRISSPNH